MPLFVWLVLMAMVEILYALPPLTAAQVMLLFDRYLGAHFFDAMAGGSAVLWQHFFWFFGHPEVYILVLPVYGIASEIIPVFSRKVMFGYPMMVAATLAIGFIGGSVWAHHMFSVGLGAPVNAFFTATTMAIAVPTGIKIFNWLATMWGGRIIFATPMLFSVAFIFQFLVAGLTGIMLAVVPFTWQVTDTYFVVAHFHYTLIGGFVFLMFAGIYYWFPKVTGRLLDERLGRWHFWLFLIGFNMTMGILHVAGLLGMPRRIYTYQTGHGWDTINLVASLGVLPQILGVLVFVANIAWSLRRGAPAGDDPWDAWTLEWTTTSPPPVYNFEAIPVVSSRRPLWDLKHPGDPDGRHE
jgi:cytochrome c oxidase subunit 1